MPILLKKRRKGVTALIVVMIVSAAGLIFAISLAFISLNEAQTSFAWVKGREVVSLAEGCQDWAVSSLAATSSYSGESLSIGDGFCIINVTDGANPSIKNVSVKASIGDYSRALTFVSQNNNEKIKVLNWKLSNSY
ncbi:MAG: hypothetical protein PHR00_01780 [Patescibacteria group bacterium]|nr:hypothetical protein [Patescibacteria group bacterium]